MSLSPLLATRALMMRIVSPSSVWATTSNRPRSETPNVTYRSSLAEWSGSKPVAAMGSLKAVVASSNETLCFRRFSRAFLRSHLKFMPATLSWSLSVANVKISSVLMSLRRKPGSQKAVKPSRVLSRRLQPLFHQRKHKLHTCLDNTRMF
jgi:hypothetical protein